MYRYATGTSRYSVLPPLGTAPKSTGSCASTGTYTRTASSSVPVAFWTRIAGTGLGQEVDPGADEIDAPRGGRAGSRRHADGDPSAPEDVGLVWDAEHGEALAP